jgi:ElaB/YqjD/DUF883 family membrane-anchored ribosome-binding protein
MSDMQQSDAEKAKRTSTETIEVLGSQLTERTRQLIEQGNVRRLIIRYPDGRVLLEIPLTFGVVAGGALVFFNPLLTGLGAIGALVAKLKIEIVRDVVDGESKQEFAFDPEPMVDRLGATVNEIATRAQPVVEDLAKRAEPIVKDLRDRAAEAVNRAGERIEDAASDVRRNVERAAEDVREEIEQRTSKSEVKDQIDEVRDDAHTTINRAASGASDVVDDAADRARRAADKLDDV